MPLYRIGVLGTPSDQQVEDLAKCLNDHISCFELVWGTDVEWAVKPATFSPSQGISTVVAYYGGPLKNNALLHPLLSSNTPIIPVISKDINASAELPAELIPLNALSYAQGGVDRVASALLEGLGLLSKQRRVFVSYRRTESRAAALQLFDELSARHFDVFLDTHGIAPGVDFQAMLWHRLCDSDVLIMLDTAGYFESRWTTAEYGRAMAKGISILQLIWPSVTPSVRTTTTTRLPLDTASINANGELGTACITEIIRKVEALRSQSHAIRSLNLVSRIKQSLLQIGGQVDGVGQHNAIFASLPNGQSITIYPTVGVPTSITLHDAHTRALGMSTAVVYDEVGLHPEWLQHLDWLGSHVQVARYVKSGSAAWDFAGW